MYGYLASDSAWLFVAGVLLLVLTGAAGIGLRGRRAGGARSQPAPRESAEERFELRDGAAVQVGPAASPDADADTDADDAAPPRRPGPPNAFRSGRDDDSFPTVLDRYELLEEIGRGAMGRVFVGRDPKINRKVAIKAVDLAAECEADEIDETSQRFLREAEAAGRLNHPDIVTIYDVGEQDGIAFIAMEYLEGRRLSDFATPDTLLPPKTVLELLGRTADALHYAHSRNVVHRDIKPANIMYDSPSNTLKLTDFGIARLIDAARTRAGIVMGTPSFMSPEQLEGRNVKGHTDLFALGVTLFQLLTGHLPFRGNSMTKLMFVIANEPHRPVTEVRPGLPSFLDAIVDTALAKDPAERYGSGADMAEALRSAAGRLA